jgi:hypothetical protein
MGTRGEIGVRGSPRPWADSSGRRHRHGRLRFRLERRSGEGSGFDIGGRRAVFEGLNEAIATTLTILTTAGEQTEHADTDA